MHILGKEVVLPKYVIRFSSGKRITISDTYMYLRSSIATCIAVRDNRIAVYDSTYYGKMYVKVGK